MLSLYFLGEFLLGLVGTKKFLLVYFIGGIVGGLFYVFLAYLLFQDMLMDAAVGASGAIFAVGGALAAMRPKVPVTIFPIPVTMPLWVAILISFLIILPGVAWQAHLGGILCGLLMGYIYRRQEGVRHY